MVELEIVRPSREVKVRMQRNVVNLEIEATKFTNIKRSGHMYITEESKDSLRRKVKDYTPDLAAKFPPVKLMCTGSPWAFKLEPMTSSLKNLNGDPFEWKLPKNFIEEATDEALK